jgi:hypothetical protein
VIDLAMAAMLLRLPERRNEACRLAEPYTETHHAAYSTAARYVLARCALEDHRLDDAERIAREGLARAGADTGASGGRERLPPRARAVREARGGFRRRSRRGRSRARRHGARLRTPSTQPSPRRALASRTEQHPRRFGGELAPIELAVHALDGDADIGEARAHLVDPYSRTSSRHCLVSPPLRSSTSLTTRRPPSSSDRRSRNRNSSPSRTLSGSGWRARSRDSSGRARRRAPGFTTRAISRSMRASSSSPK